MILVLCREKRKKYKKKNLLLKRIKSALVTGLHIKFGIFMGSVLTSMSRKIKPSRGQNIEVQKYVHSTL